MGAEFRSDPSTHADCGNGMDLFTGAAADVAHPKWMHFAEPPLAGHYPQKGDGLLGSSDRCGAFMMSPGSHARFPSVVVGGSPRVAFWFGGFPSTFDDQESFDRLRFFGRLLYR